MKGSLYLCSRHSGAEFNGSGPEWPAHDKLREQPGIHNHGQRIWIADLPPSKSAFADLGL